MDNIKIKTLSLKSYDKIFISIDFKQAWTLVEIKSLLNEALDYIANENLFVVNEKAIGSMEYMNFYLQLREELFKSHDLTAPPNTYIEGLSITRTCLISVTFCAILIKDSRIKGSYSNDEEKRVAAALLAFDTVSYLYLSNINVSRHNHSDLESLNTWQKLNPLITQNGFELNEVLRSNIRINDIHRIEKKKEYEIIDMPENADKDVAVDEAVISANYKIDVELLCMKPHNSHPMHRNLQLQYKQTSSNGLLVEEDESFEIQIHGKTNFKIAGAHVPTDKVYIQIYNTLINLKLILEQAGMSYDDVFEARLYFKNKDYYVIYKQAAEDIGLPDIYASFVVGDIHREDLLFELEATACKAK